MKFPKVGKKVFLIGVFIWENREWDFHCFSFYNTLRCCSSY
ncbi:hypothetical protein CpecG_0039 [Chlamydia pecorum MC/MarsBar]|uniref:Uncharacterized protein n=1 Tax=Chlamydia pecorum (strain ATCC VR-628 / DSM 29919 / E58) TaxID=331635 RepID=A0AA34RC87_CHLPE|nr:hypothetical protein G5S_0045 [Chlamydia pecorum E58]ETF38433.1 hypothetical protein CpecS_0041 [Chlamydia pecorum VR629]ETF38939.1 hypothetical protein CpecF_0039 [Chlamydia pecorum DBDeUG]ETF39615.1 hypothetical protein CpecG_0039 [Chlamydia pecorum MC/MarsBar]ETF40664.1 hypothetical protein CpecA_0039 [Chlamydia pecorum IPTaLE]